MLRIRSIATAVLSLGITAAIPAFTQAAERGHSERTPSREVHAAPRVENHGDRRVETRVEHRAPVVERTRVERERVIRDVHVDRGNHFDRGYHDDHGIRFGVDVRPVYPVYPAYPVYVNNDCDLSVSLGDVPTCVLDTLDRECRGDIASARLIRTNGLEYYRLIVNTRSGAFEAHVGCDGRLISVGHC